MNSDYKPSANLVGEQPAHHVSPRTVFASLLAVIAVLVVLNVFFPEPAASCDRPTQVSQK
jgi:hypothetical protein